MLHRGLDGLVHVHEHEHEHEQRGQADVEMPAHDQPAPAEHEAHGQDVVDEGHEREGRGLGALHLERAVGEALVGCAQLLDPALLGAEGLDRARAGEILVQRLDELRGFLLAAVGALERAHAELAHGEEERHPEEDHQREDRGEADEEQQAREHLQDRPGGAEDHRQTPGVARRVVERPLEEIPALALLEEGHRLVEHLAAHRLANVHADAHLHHVGNVGVPVGGRAHHERREREQDQGRVERRVAVELRRPPARPCGLVERFVPWLDPRLRDPALGDPVHGQDDVLHHAADRAAGLLLEDLGGLLLLDAHALHFRGHRDVGQAQAGEHRQGEDDAPDAEHAGQRHEDRGGGEHLPVRATPPHDVVDGPAQSADALDGAELGRARRRGHRRGGAGGRRRRRGGGCSGGAHRRAGAPQDPPGRV